MKPEKLIDRLVKITDRESIYFNQWGFIVEWDGDAFHVTGGSIASYNNPDVVPIFDRDQFALPNKKSLEVYRKMGLKLDDNGYRIKQ